MMHSDITTFFLRLKKQPLILSELSFLKGENVDDISSFRQFSSGMLSIEEEDKLESFMVHEIDREVKYFVQNKYYTIRLLSSAFAFLLLYLFFSLVVRDPIPLVDEIALGLLGAIGVWIFLNKKEGHGAYANKAKLDLKELYQERKVSSSSFLEEVEAYVYDLDSRYDNLTLCDILALNQKGEALPKLEYTKGEESEIFIALFEKYLKKDRMLYSFFKRIKANRSANRQLAAQLVNANMAGLDLLLLSLSVLLLD